MTELLIALRDAKPIDDALLEVYGFDTDGLEDAWRQSVVPRPGLFLPSQHRSQPRHMSPPMCPSQVHHWP